MNTEPDRTAQLLGRRLHMMVDDVVERPDALARILADTAHSQHVPGNRAAMRTRFKVLTAAAAAAVLAGGVYLALPHDNANGSGQATASPGPRVTLTASVVLYRVAQVADTSTLTPPRPDQYEYIKSVGVANGRTRTVEMWLPQSATAEGIVHTDGKFGYVIEPWATGLTKSALAHATYPNYAFLASLPTDPATVLPALDANGKHQAPGYSATQTAFVNVMGLVSDQIVPGKLAAGIYRALAVLPGISVDQNVVDAAGRPGVGVGTTYPDGTRVELIFDRTSFTLLGTDSASPAHSPKNGAVHYAGPSRDAIVDEAIVDSAGQVPAK